MFRSYLIDYYFFKVFMTFYAHRVVASFGMDMKKYY